MTENERYFGSYYYDVLDAMEKFGTIAERDEVERLREQEQEEDY